jgi:hypothetical protein
LIELGTKDLLQIIWDPSGYFVERIAQTIPAELDQSIGPADEPVRKQILSKQNAPKQTQYIQNVSKQSRLERNPFKHSPLNPSPVKLSPLQSSPLTYSFPNAKGHRRKEVALGALQAEPVVPNEEAILKH